MVGFRAFLFKMLTEAQSIRKEENKTTKQYIEIRVSKLEIGSITEMKVFFEEIPQRTLKLKQTLKRVYFAYHGLN